MRAPNFKIVELKAGAKVKNVPGTSAYPRSRFHHFKDEWENKSSPHYKGTRLEKNLRRVWPKKCTYIFLEELVDYFLYRERIIYLLIYRYSNSKLKSQKIMISVNVTHLQSKDLRKTQNCYRFFDYGFLCQMKTTHFFKDIYFLRN